jgi:Tol biopolymer transport system component
MYLGLASPGGLFHIAVAARPALVADFGAPQLVANVNSSAYDNDPMIDDGAQNLYFTSTRTANNIDIYRATRMAAGAFGTPTSIAEIDTAATEHMPVITPDGLALYFASDRGGHGDDIWIARRASPSQPFLAPVLVTELSSDVDDAPTWVATDECTIYLRRGATGGPRDIWMAARPK